jgi:hypothetical protein
MTPETMMALAVRACRTRLELVEIAAELLAAAAFAHAAGRGALRDRLVDTAADVLAASPGGGAWCDC